MLYIDPSVLGDHMEQLVNIPIVLALSFIVLHFIAEYIFQPPKSITLTGNSPIRIVNHCICHAIPFGVFGAHFFVLIGLLHFIIEMSLDKIISQYWSGNRIRHHRIYIGLSQTLHTLSIFLVYNFIGVNYILIDAVREFLQI